MVRYDNDRGERSEPHENFWIWVLQHFCKTATFLQL